MSSLDYVDDSKVLLNDLLDGTKYTIYYILQKLHENNADFIRKLDGARVVGVRPLKKEIIS
jgi:hypothetical protein